VGVCRQAHNGKFSSLPATGKNVRVSLCAVYGLENGQIKREWKTKNSGDLRELDIVI
jgi:predicted ester cyclase